MNKPFEFLPLNQNSKIPFPSLDYVKEEITTATSKEPHLKKKGELVKHEKAYDAFCHWAATPPEERQPKTATAFEKKWGLTARYTQFFKQRDDFLNRFKKYLWEWIRNLYPDYINKMYRLAVKEGNPSAIKFFAEIIAKDLEIEKPKAKIQPFVFIGVDQSKIDKLFQPEGLNDVENIIPGEEDK